MFTPGKPLAEEMEAVKAKSGEKMIHKQHPGSFAGTELLEVVGWEGCEEGGVGGVHGAFGLFIQG